MDFLPLGFSRTAVIVSGLAAPAGLVGGPHVVRFIRTSKLQRTYVFDDPSLPDTVDRLLTQNADAARPLPD
ncbi:hypothetical protein BB934_05110 [Microvirga ossetica]|uniref:Uncharacterized protein n=1 Tax=Microvirga ossetica TaxID=1882682 RepID=A0A1B2ECK4_9HYPH|nr:hypothetical protein BB934_05110 [Microvirga ossetica]